MENYETREVIFTCICTSLVRLGRETKILNAALTGNIFERMFNDGRGFSKKLQKHVRSEKGA